MRNAQPHKLVGRSDDGYCYTDNLPNQWMSVDLGAGRSVVPTRYCLKNDRLGCFFALRHWTLQGRVEADGAWEDLRRHGNDTALTAAMYFVAAWPVEGATKSYRFFRILQHGPNAYPGCRRMHYSLVCCGFELYGVLRECV